MSLSNTEGIEVLKRADAKAIFAVEAIKTIISLWI